MIKQTKDGFILELRLIPNSSKNEIIIENTDALKIKLTAQPIENKANKALIEFLSKELKISKTKIIIIKGLTSKNKEILFNITEDDAKRVVNILNNIERKA